mmetsp:Transcript_96755/g.273368  ORF Transcript_96755/g.273368 Transcript_96755/m.273368 type:complete len:256 (+) Transcript_96755:1090-1857(+)
MLRAQQNLPPLARRLEVQVVLKATIRLHGPQDVRAVQALVVAVATAPKAPVVVLPEFIITHTRRSANIEHDHVFGGQVRHHELDCHVVGTYHSQEAPLLVGVARDECVGARGPCAHVQGDEGRSVDERKQYHRMALDAVPDERLTVVLSVRDVLKEFAVKAERIQCGIPVGFQQPLSNVRRQRRRTISSSASGSCLRMPIARITSWRGGKRTMGDPISEPDRGLRAQHTNGARPPTATCMRKQAHGIGATRSAGP